MVASCCYVSLKTQQFFIIKIQRFEVMFCIRIDDTLVRIDNRYSYIYRLYEDYEVKVLSAFFHNS